ncbi:hypothetical protein AX17_005983 [Amanita inopinata Kibby_2008]|nr:hypothetical protein AX17_005983 [Amanita inopinata Kibby_2008]
MVSREHSMEEGHPLLHPLLDNHCQTTSTLPKLQIAIILFLQVCEPLAGQSIYPYINELISSLDVTGGDTRLVGYYAGLIESLFYMTEALTVLHWSRLSDHVGRKPVLLLGLFGTALSMICFGLSRTFWTLVASRCLCGLLNGNTGVMKSVMGELTNQSNRATAFSLMPVVWAAGATLGPLIGGSLSRPHIRFPSLFRARFWQEYPYFFSCLVVSIYIFFAFALTLLLFEETVPTPYSRKGKHHRTSRATPVPISRLLVYPVLISVANYASLAFMNIMVSALLPLFFAMPIRFGGLGAVEPISMGRLVEEDPLTLAIAPPANETHEERVAREAAEAEARRVNDEIDEQLKREKEQEKKKKRPIKLLLLGQSESGKTATLKNFQLTYARREWTEERASWRAVIYLNLVRSVNQILNLLAKETAERNGINCNGNASDDSAEEMHVARAKALPPLKFKEKHRLLRQRLSPLLGVQIDLEGRLGAAAMEMHTTSVNTAAPFDNISPPTKGAISEFSIHSRNGWKSALDKIRTLRGGRTESESEALKTSNDLEDEVVETIVSCRDDMKELWEDSLIQEMLNRRKVRIEDSPGFFLNDAERIATWNYQPTDDDVIRARLRTLGVQEYKFIFDHGRAVGREWWMYDVGGTRNSRAAWYPYFDDVDAIIFLAPISPFDEKLSEDKRVNRLEDSYLLWRSVCANKLLARTQLILFLNKCDLLQAKLQRGLRIRDSVPSFGDRKNDLPTATKYFQQHFREIARQNSPSRRSLFVHLTSVIDTKSTAITLGAVEECILREHLRRADLM